MVTMAVSGCFTSSLTLWLAVSPLSRVTVTVTSSENDFVA
jgi:hypothetical protein